VATGSKSLKSMNAAWIWALVVVDAIACGLVADPWLVRSLRTVEDAWIRVSVAAAAPVIVMLLSSLLTSDFKAKLVYWRRTNVLPGHRAFTVHGPNDARIDMEALKTRIGEWPVEESQQNKFWYRLYKDTQQDVTVSEAHQRYLLFRDLAALSLLLVPFALLALFVTGALTWPKAAWVVCLFAVQYVLCAIAARNSGVRMVTSVLAVHYTKSEAVTAKKATRTRAKKDSEGA
jgi:hypothetical protein